jgi:hypothetical protein
MGAVESADGRHELDPSADPAFRVEVSLRPLAEAWRRGGHGTPGWLVARVADELDRAPDLLRPLEDQIVLARHAPLVDLLMSRVVSASAWESAYAAAMVPFAGQAFYPTPQFERLLLGPDRRLRGRMNVDPESARWGRQLHAYDIILSAHYGMSLGLDYPLILTVEDPDTGLDRHFRLRWDRQFLEVRAPDGLPVLSEADRARIRARSTDVELLRELLPPEAFVFHGFAVLRADDVTDQEVLTALDRDLVDKESIVSDARFERLQQMLRIFLKRPALLLGLAAIHGERVLMLNYGTRLEHQCIFADSVHRTTRDFAGSIYDRAIAEGQALIIDDLTTYPHITPVEERLIASGLRSVVVAPLHYQDRVIGTLEIGSPVPGDLDAMRALKLRELLPVFSMAVYRGLDELENRVQAVIKEQCTAIHPTVEWRFRQAVLDAIEDHEDGPLEIEPIVFRDVHPLYGASDIRGSSTQRNVAIQADLLAHLRLAREVVEAARETRPLPALDELAYRLDRRLEQVETSLASGDEVSVIAFLREHLEPLLQHMSGFGPAVWGRIERYRAALDPQLGTVYRQRRDYDESVTLLNDTISSYLDAEQELAQGMFPHYFEKQRTDGVDYSIYLGGSLVEDGRFDTLYLRNLRLWQLMVTCGIARRVEAVRPRLRTDLEVTHLVLVHHAPLSIRFRSDEKRFDVDGAYNVRYEVVKKRIDKAVVRGSHERITQPGWIAIIYSQPAEAQEYRAYLEYLIAAGYLTGPVDDLPLEELQGVHGLRALRVAINLAPDAPELDLAARVAEAGTRALAI